MKFGEFWLEVIIFALLVLILYLAQPNFAKEHPGIASFFSPNSPTSTTGKVTITPGTKISPGY